MSWCLNSAFMPGVHRYRSETKNLGQPAHPEKRKNNSIAGPRQGSAQHTHRRHHHTKIRVRPGQAAGQNIPLHKEQHFCATPASRGVCIQLLFAFILHSIDQSIWTVFRLLPHLSSLSEISATQRTRPKVSYYTISSRFPTRH